MRRASRIGDERQYPRGAQVRLQDRLSRHHGDEAIDDDRLREQGDDAERGKQLRHQNACPMLKWMM